MKRLEKLLENGPVAVNQIELEIDVAKKTLERWKKKLGVVAYQEDRQWFWSLPQTDTQNSQTDTHNVGVNPQADILSDGVQLRTVDGHPFFYVGGSKRWGLIEAPGIGSVDKVPDYEFPKRQPVEDLTKIPYEDLVELVNETGFRSSYYDEIVRRRTIILRDI